MSCFSILRGDLRRRVPPCDALLRGWASDTGVFFASLLGPCGAGATLSMTAELLHWSATSSEQRWPVPGSGPRLVTAGHPVEPDVTWVVATTSSPGEPFQPTLPATLWMRSGRFVQVAEVPHPDVEQVAVHAGTVWLRTGGGVLLRLRETSGWQRIRPVPDQRLLLPDARHRRRAVAPRRR